MDLYKHAFRLSPLVSSDLVADCFELAWEIRTMDMPATPRPRRARPRSDPHRDGRRQAGVRRRPA
ncbi:hypothetical protein [Nocardioides turkmenicus]|uniref:hypothetical protein n=1 Tax=Nocardioides turkmenicus TaxID=2711220 RepID=UPI001F49D5C2|nr:hypothetical protein [Nocardioides sp. KC13]